MGETQALDLSLLADFCFGLCGFRDRFGIWSGVGFPGDRPGEVSAV